MKEPKKPAPFNNPFGKLKELVKANPPAPRSGPPRRASVGAEKAPPPNKADDDSTLFLQHVGEVVPVKRRAAAARIDKVPTPPRVVTDEDEALLQLTELVSGSGIFDFADSDEYIEGAVPGLDWRIVERLHRGDFTFQGHLDLHGLTRAEAKAQFTVFLQASRLKGHRCVLIVHGRGLHSKDNIPVLKESVQTWLTRGRLAREVLAFTTAQPHDGGAGAIYVLLRR